MFTYIYKIVEIQIVLLMIINATIQRNPSGKYSWLSATIYLIGFQFSKQVGAIFLSTIAGKMEDTVGLQNAYLLLGSIALMFTIISIFTLSGKKIVVVKNVSVQKTS